MSSDPALEPVQLALVVGETNFGIPTPEAVDQYEEGENRQQASYDNQDIHELNSTQIASVVVDETGESSGQLDVSLLRKITNDTKLSCK